MAGGERGREATHVLPLFRLGGVVDEKGVEGEGVGEDEVADVAAADGERVERLGFAIPDRHLDRLEMRVHARVNACQRGITSATTLM